VKQRAREFIKNRPSITDQPSAAPIFVNKTKEKPEKGKAKLF